MKITLDSSVRIIIDLAKDDIRKLKYDVLTAEHIMAVMLHIYPIKKLLESVDVDFNGLRIELEKYIAILARQDTSRYNQQNNGTQTQAESPPTSKMGSEQEIRHSESFARLMEYAFVNTAKEERNIVGLRDILLAFTTLEQQNSTGFPYGNFINLNKFRYFLHSDVDMIEELSEIELEMFSSLYVEDDADFFLEEDESHRGGGNEVEPVLEKITTDLCALAKKRNDLFIGQDDVFHHMYEVMLRKNKNNVLLVGDSGVGKSALVQEFAKRLVEGRVPDELKDYTVLSLDIISLVAGTRYRGDFEDRVKRLIDSLIGMQKCILFLDDIHNIINAGASTGNSNDFGDLIKPLLVDNVIRCIGSTTHDELKTFEREKMLLRRFNIVEMDEPSDTETLRIIEELKGQYENFFQVQYEDGVLDDIVGLSRKYITERAFPDKAIDVLDSLGAMIKIEEFKSLRESDSEKKKSNKKHTELRQRRLAVDAVDEAVQEKAVVSITTSDVERIVSRISKRPLHGIKKNELGHLRKLETRLSKKIFGQEEAIHSLSRVIIRSRAGLREETKPIASLLFVGHTGVGKTEISRQLAEEMGMQFQRFDMSEYQERHTVSKFIGSPPGYVGHESGGLLIDSIRRYPYSVLLLDEIEKAHQDIFNLLLQIMDYATISDSKGRKADFRNVIIIMTSNAGAQESVAPIVGFEGQSLKGNDEIKKAVENIFTPEFRNRLDETIIFSSLNQRHMRSIVFKELKKVRERLEKNDVKLEWDSNVIRFLIRKGFSSVYGARSILRTVETLIKDKIADFLLHRGNVDVKDEGHSVLVLSVKQVKKEGGKEQEEIEVSEHQVQTSMRSLEESASKQSVKVKNNPSLIK